MIDATSDTSGRNALTKAIEHADYAGDDDRDVGLEQRGDEDRRRRDRQDVRQEVAMLVGQHERQVELRDEQRRRRDQRQRDQVALGRDAARLQ